MSQLFYQATRYRKIPYSVHTTHPTRLKSELAIKPLQLTVEEVNMPGHASTQTFEHKFVGNTRMIHANLRTHT